ncbi:MAG: hypothetical protein ACI4EW_03050 [Butyrivibrio sp.]
MKKTLTEIFDETDAEEIDIVLEENITSETVDEISMERIQKNVFSQINCQEHNKTKKYRKIKRLIPVAAGILLATVAGFGIRTYAAEVKEYKAAVSFFNDNDLPTQGLSRGEIKAVYKDITTSSFTYFKTAEVIEKCIINSTVEGYEIFQDEPTPELLEDLWNCKNGNGLNTVNKSGDDVSYRYYYDEKYDSELGFEIHDKSYFEKYVGDTLVWQIAVSEFYIDGYEEVEDGVIVYGATPVWNSEQKQYAWILKADNSGNVLWKEKADNGFDYEYIQAIVENKDGSYAVFGRGDSEYIWISRYDKEGNVTDLSKIPAKDKSIENAARLKDGYILQLVSLTGSEQEVIFKVDKAGNVTKSFCYEGNDCFYYITDMMEYSGNIYLSAYSVPKYSVKQDAGNIDEIYYVLDKIMHSAGDGGISKSDIVSLLRENYTATLLVCNPESGEPQEFYMAEGSFGGELSIGESGELVWEVEKIVDAEFSPYTSAYVISGSCRLFRYTLASYNISKDTFNNIGILIRQEKTDEYVEFIK